MLWRKNKGCTTAIRVFCEQVFIVFLGLKWSGVIDWSWWWVTAPLWIPTILALILVVFILRMIRKANNS